MGLGVVEKNFLAKVVSGGLKGLAGEVFFINSVRAAEGMLRATKNKNNLMAMATTGQQLSNVAKRQSKYPSQGPQWRYRRQIGGGIRIASPLANVFHYYRRLRSKCPSIIVNSYNDDLYAVAWVKWFLETLGRQRAWGWGMRHLPCRSRTYTEPWRPIDGATGTTVPC